MISIVCLYDFATITMVTYFSHLMRFTNGIDKWTSRIWDFNECHPLFWTITKRFDIIFKWCRYYYLANEFVLLTRLKWWAKKMDLIALHVLQPSERMIYFYCLIPEDTTALFLIRRSNKELKSLQYSRFIKWYGIYLLLNV